MGNRTLWLGSFVVAVTALACSSSVDDVAKLTAHEPAVAVALPRGPTAASGTCMAAGKRLSWDESSRRFQIDDAIYVLDEHGRPAEQTDESGAVHNTFRYDDHGTLVFARYFFHGTDTPAMSSDGEASYDDDRLVSLTHRSVDGTVVVASTFEYEGENQVRASLTVTRADPSTFLQDASLRWDRGNVVERTTSYSSQPGGSGVVREELEYEGSRLTRVVTDGTSTTEPDGVPDGTVEWRYDAEGRCLERTIESQGGDRDTVTFDASCADIAMLPHQVYGFLDCYTP